MSWAGSDAANQASASPGPVVSASNMFFTRSKATLLSYCINYMLRYCFTETPVSSIKVYGMLSHKSFSPAPELIVWCWK